LRGSAHRSGPTSRVYVNGPTGALCPRSPSIKPFRGDADPRERPASWTDFIAGQGFGGAGATMPAG
jgi:hypothetical protein